MKPTKIETGLVVVDFEGSEWHVLTEPDYADQVCCINRYKTYNNRFQNENVVEDIDWLMEIATENSYLIVPG